MVDCPRLWLAWLLSLLKCSVLVSGLMLAGLPAAHAQNSPEAVNWLEQFAAADQAAADAAPRRSTTFNVDRNRRISDVLLSLQLERNAAVPGVGEPPSVNSDLRFRRNLVAMATQTTSSGRARVFGGEKVIPPEYSDVVGLVGVADNVCTGILISDSVVLTAAHCVCAGMAKVVVGTSVYSPLARNQYRISGKDTLTPCGTGAARTRPPPGKDVGLLYLSGSPGVTVRPVTVLGSSIDLHAVGFGLTLEGDIGIKYGGDVPVASATCSSERNGIADADYYKCVAGSEAVAGMKGLKKDTCTGDSGGPALVRLQDGTYALVAITSRGVGFPGAAQCGDGGIYELITGDILRWLTVTKQIKLKIV